MTSPALGRSLELYYIDGRPDGMLTAEMFNWTGHVLMVPRTQLAAALARDETKHAGVYLLLGEDRGEPLAYVGESEDVGSRIKTHDVGKDWWTTAVLVVTAGAKLNKAHVRYLEARLIEEARAIGRTRLDNTVNPPRPTLSEADVSKMEGFLQNILLVLPAVRVDVFIPRVRQETRDPNASEPTIARFVLTLKKHNLSATAVVEDGEFIVEKGSTARLNWEGHEVSRSSYADLHDELKRSGVLTPQGEHCVFTQNCAFTSPSAAAAVVSGRTANGVISWFTPSGMTYKVWEAQQLSAAGKQAG